ncbi:MAG: hypothetical protein M5U35_16135 [Roseovarius sp.]|nr:hypothetical protein [Roseovarius sp.]
MPHISPPSWWCWASSRRRARDLGRGRAGQGRILVVCTGDGLRTLHIDPDGIPAEISDTADHCALVHAAGTAPAVVPAPLPRRLIATGTRPLTRLPAMVARPPLPSLPRAPPAA